MSPNIVFGQTNVIYVNGIQNTLIAAKLSERNMGNILNASPNHTGAAKRRFFTSTIWDPVGFYYTLPDTWLGKLRGWQEDITELFIFKTAEENFAKYLPGLVCRHNDLPNLNQVSARIVVQQSLEDLTPGNNDLERIQRVTDSTLEPTKKVILSLVKSVTTKRRAVVVAHSQGNLLANLAWFKLVADFGNGANSMMRLVNVANTTLVSIHNLNFTHHGDIALSILRIVPVLLSLNRETERCNGICSFDMDTKTLPAVSGGDDFFLHDFDKTYLGTLTLPARASGGYNPGVIESAGSRMVDRFEDFVYAAAQSLEYPILINAGDEISIRFRMLNAYSLTNSLSIRVGPGSDLSTRYNFSAALRDGARLLGMDANTFSEGAIAYVWVTADSPLFSGLNNVIEFDSIRAASIDGTASFKLSQGSFSFEPRYTREGASKSAVIEACWWEVHGCSIAQEALVRDISVNGARLWRPLCPDFRENAPLCIDETMVHPDNRG